MADSRPTTSNACVIGAGFGGLALAIRLQSAGIATTVIEGRDKPGGRAYFWEKETEAGTFTFDGGPTVVTDPDCLKELWALTGHDIARDVELMPVMPFYRLAWPDGTQFDYSNDEEDEGYSRRKEKKKCEEPTPTTEGNLLGYQQHLPAVRGMPFGCVDVSALHCGRKRRNYW